MDQSNSSGALLSSTEQQMLPFRNAQSETIKRFDHDKKVVATERKKIENWISRPPDSEFACSSTRRPILNVS